MRLLLIIKTRGRSLVILAAAAWLLSRGAGPTIASRVPTAAEIRAVLADVRAECKLPALGGAVVTSRGLLALATVGVRKAGTEVAVTDDDLWHLGSDTKAMTAALIGALVEKGRLRWETTVGEIFPDLAAASDSPLAKADLRHLLSHHAGLPGAPANGWFLVPRADAVQGQRRNTVALALKEKPIGGLGEKYLYSNYGYVVAGAMAEQATGASWEELLTAEVLNPLGMLSAGFGGVGTPGEIDQPWGHGANGKPVNGNGPAIDNPPVMGPAGRAHCKLSDWAKFVADQLRGARGESALLKPETYRVLHTPPFGGDYSLGWSVAERDWGGGKVLAHAGSNLMNFALVWMAPLKDFAVLVVTNQGGPAAERGCDEAAGTLIERMRGAASP